MLRPRSLCYVHIYKCGGSSLRHHVRKHLVTRETRLIEQRVYVWERPISRADRALCNMIRAEHLRQLSMTWDANEHVVILTHTFFYEFMKRWGPFSFATLLRDPIERIISQFHFERRTFSDCRDVELHAWLDAISPFDYNLQTAALCGGPCTEIESAHVQMAKANLHCFDFVGLVEEFPASTSLFNWTYGIAGNAPIERLNASPDSAAIPESLRATLEDRCRFDIDLVAHGRRLFLAKQAAMEVMRSADASALPTVLAQRFPGATARSG